LMYRPSPSGFAGTSDTGKLYAVWPAPGGALAPVVSFATVVGGAVDIARAIASLQSREGDAGGAGRGEGGRRDERGALCARWRESERRRAPARAPDIQLRDVRTCVRVFMCTGLRLGSDGRVNAASVDECAREKAETRAVDVESMIDEPSISLAKSFATMSRRSVHN
jgi:hypothetical protein